MPVLAAFSACAVLVMAQPDMGTTLVMGCIVFALLFIGGVQLRSMAALLATGAFGAFVLGMLEPYRRARMLAFLHPLADTSNTGYQSLQGLVALGSGGLTGSGLGASRAKWGFLPNAHTDFIFAIIGDELGLIGTLLVVALFVALAVLGVRAAARAPDRFGALLAAGITAWLVGQAVLNIGAVIGLLPVTGVPLPFVSYGGTSLVIAMALVGVLLNIARQSRPAPPRRRTADRH
jgi:cell division protein FtsW